MKKVSRSNKKSISFYFWNNIDFNVIFCWFYTKKGEKLSNYLLHRKYRHSDQRLFNKN